MSPLGCFIISVGWLNGPAARCTSQSVTSPVSECLPGVPSASLTLPSSENDLGTEAEGRGVAALKHIDAVLIVRRHSADQAERFSIRRFEEIADQLVGVSARVSPAH